MADNVIRRDVVQIEFESDALKEIQKLRKEIDDLKAKLLGGVGEEEFDETKESAQKARKEVDKMTASTGKLKSALTSVAKISFKALVGGIGAATVAVGTLVTKSVNAYAEFEQLEGGVKKIFDEADLSQIKKDADNAYKDLGLSANDYLRTINDVGANLAATMGDQKGYDAARSGLKAISDYASGTGKDVDTLSEKFTMITRSTGSYQSIADQFSGILPATSANFLKQAQAAGLLSKSYSKLTDVPIDEYQAAITEMLSIGVDKLNLTDNTAKEASTTISGSLSMMGAAWQNLQKGFIQGGDDLDRCIENFVDSVLVVGDLLVPVIEKALGGIGTLIEKVTPMIEEKLPDLVEDLLPPLLKAATSLLKGFIKALPAIVKTIIDELPYILKEVGAALGDVFGFEIPGLSKFGNFISENGDKIKKFTPILIGFAGALVLLTKMKSVGNIFSGLFGGSGGSGGKSGGMFSGLTELAKIKPTIILKGIANIAIVLGGFTLLGAAFAAVAPFIAQLSDIQSLIEVAAIVAVLGIVGSALTKFAGVAGAIPIVTVAKGLANMAIVLVGMTALGAAFAWAAPYIAELSDLKSILKVAAIITILGGVGTVLAVFAGIAGVIPFPVVLAGLANIALVLGGMTALITAYGALAKIPGFSDFITKGGDLLATLFGQIGKIVGSLAGGFLEGITSTLPQIGESLGQFGENIKPLFAIFNGVDTAGLGDFFLGLAGFIGAIAVDKIVSFFGGGDTGFASVAEGLGALAGEGTKKFFAMVKEIQEPAYTNAGKFFTALDGISKLPNVGGLGQLFSGENDYSGVASGLTALTKPGVKNFFAMVAGMEESAFTNAEKFFTSLDGISKLPNVGGIGQIFSGENDFSGVAKGLEVLSRQGVKNFFAMVNGISDDTLARTTALFDTLAGISKVGKKGFWESVGDALGGGEEPPLSGIAKGLGDFAEKAGTFFTLVNGLELGNLNGLWDSLERAEGLSADIAVDIGKDLDDIVKKVSDLPSRMGEGLRAAGQSLSSAIVAVWKDAVKASVAPVNKLLSGANHILKEFGSDKRVISWEPYAKGTDGHKGGNALVNDGRGAELVQMPNGLSFIPRGKNVLIPNAPKGMKVLPAGNTAQLMGRSSPTFRYANGTGDIDIWSFIDNPSGLVSEIVDGISYEGMSSFAASAGKGMVTTFSGAMTGWTKKLFEEEGILGLASYVAGKGVSQWRSTVIRALKMEGQYSASNVAKTLFQMQTESGGNPRAINLWDSNAKKGIPSKGLMQVIDPTFNAYARSGFDKNIYDPLSNILASIRYAVSRYGSLGKAYRGVGYANGGFANTPSIFGEDGLEAAIPLSRDKRQRGISLWAQTGAMLGLSDYSPEKDGDTYSTNHVEQNTYSPQFNLTITGTNDDRAMARKVKTWVKEAMDEMFSSLEAKNPRLQEV